MNNLKQKKSNNKRKNIESNILKLKLLFPCNNAKILFMQNLEAYEIANK